MLRNSLRSRVSCASIAGVLAAAAGHASANPAFHEVIARSGVSLPGLPGISTGHFWDVTHHSLSGNRVFFSAQTLSGPGVTVDNDHAFFAGFAETPSLIAREGMPAPGLGGYTLNSWYSPVVLDSGQILFMGILKGPGISELVNDQVIYAGVPGLVSPMLRDGQAAPLLASGVNIKRIGWLEFDAQGKASFGCTLQGAGITTDVNDQIFYYGYPNNLQKLARRGEQAAGLPAGVTYDWLHNWHSRSHEGKVGFIMNLKGAGVTTANNQAAFAGTPGNLSMVLRTGTQAPGQGAGVVMSELILSYSINNAGNQTITGRVAGAGVTTANDTAMIVVLPGGPVMLAREGSQVPGLANGIQFGSMEWAEPPYAVIGPANRIMMNTTFKGIGVTELNDTGLWAGQAGSMQLLARESLQVPGAEQGIVWGQFTVPRMASNNVGQITFFAEMRDTATNADLHGIFLREPWGGLRSIVQSGDTLMLGPADYRVVKWVEPGYDGAGETGGRTVLTDSGLIMGNVTFTDGSTAIVRFDVNRVCPADFDSSGFVDTEDYDAFVEAFEAGVNAADFDKSGFVDTDDFDAFVEAFTEGC